MELYEQNGNISSHKSAGCGDHDGRYYHKIEIDSMMGSKAGASHNHDNRYYTEGEINNLLKYTHGQGSRSSSISAADCELNWHKYGRVCIICFAVRPAKTFGTNEILATGFPAAVAIQTASVPVINQAKTGDRGNVAIDGEGNLKYWYAMEPEIGSWIKGSIVYISEN